MVGASLLTHVWVTPYAKSSRHKEFISRARYSFNPDAFVLPGKNWWTVESRAPQAFWIHQRWGSYRRDVKVGRSSGGNRSDLGGCSCREQNKVRRQLPQSSVQWKKWVKRRFRRRKKGKRLGGECTHLQTLPAHFSRNECMRGVWGGHSVPLLSSPPPR